MRGKSKKVSREEFDKLIEKGKYKDAHPDAGGFNIYDETPTKKHLSKVVEGSSIVYWRVYESFEKQLINPPKRPWRMRVSTKYLYKPTLEITSNQKEWFSHCLLENEVYTLNYGVGSGISYKSYAHNKKLFIRNYGLFRYQDEDINVILSLPEKYHQYFTFSPSNEKAKKILNWRKIKKNS
jgi:hypothetical protein